MKTLRERVEECSRRRPHITQAQVARAAGIKQPSVFGWFNGTTTRLQLRTAVKAARLWGCDPLWLGEGEGLPHWTDEPTASVSDLAAALPVVLGRLAGLDEYTADKVLGALKAATRPRAPLEAIERDLLAWLGAPATPEAAPRKRQRQA